MAKGLGGMPGNMQQMMQQAQKMQQDLAKVQAEAENETAEGTAGGGMVTAIANGKQQITSLTIKPDVVDKDDIEMLQDLTLAAVNQALDNVGLKIKEKMSKVTGGLNIPGLT